MKGDVMSYLAFYDEIESKSIKGHVMSYLSFHGEIQSKSTNSEFHGEAESKSMMGDVVPSLFIMFIIGWRFT